MWNSTLIIRLILLTLSIIYVGYCYSEEYLEACEINIDFNSLDGPYYYQSWKTKKVPFEPKGIISKNQAHIRKNYYSAYYKNGRILYFSKWLDRKQVWDTLYEYSDDHVLIKRTFRDFERCERNQSFKEIEHRHP